MSKRIKVKGLRQGDIALANITGVRELPKGAKKAKNNVLALGEVTGHMHTVVDGEAETYHSGNDIYIQVKSETATLAHGNESQVARWIAGEELDMVKEDVHGPHTLEKGLYWFQGQEEYSPAGWNRVID